MKFKVRDHGRGPLRARNNSNLPYQYWTLRMYDIVRREKCQNLLFNASYSYSQAYKIRSQNTSLKAFLSSFTRFWSDPLLVTYFSSTLYYKGVILHTSWPYEYRLPLTKLPHSCFSPVKQSAWPAHWTFDMQALCHNAHGMLTIRYNHIILQAWSIQLLHASLQVELVFMHNEKKMLFGNLFTCSSQYNVFGL